MKNKKRRKVTHVYKKWINYPGPKDLIGVGVDTRHPDDQTPGLTPSKPASIEHFVEDGQMFNRISY